MRTTIRQLLDARAAKPKPTPPAKPYHRWTISELKLLADRTLSAAQLAVKLGVSRSAVYSQRRMQRLGALLLVAALGWGQTTIAPSQLRAGMPGEAEKIRLFAVSLSGMVQVQVGPGLRLVMVNGVPTLQAAPVPMVRKRIRLSQDPNQNYPGPPGAEIFRNGSLMTEGEDYTTNSGGIIPIAVPSVSGKPEKWAAGDIVVALVFVPAEAVPP